MSENSNPVQAPECLKARLAPEEEVMHVEKLKRNTGAFITISLVILLVLVAIVILSVYYLLIKLNFEEPLAQFATRLLGIVAVVGFSVALLYIIKTVIVLIPEETLVVTNLAIYVLVGKKPFICKYIYYSDIDRGILCKNGVLFVSQTLAYEKAHKKYREKFNKCFVKAVKCRITKTECELQMTPLVLEPIHGGYRHTRKLYMATGFSISKYSVLPAIMRKIAYDHLNKPGGTFPKYEFQDI